MSRKKAKMLFWRRSSCSPTFPTSCSPPATPSCSFRIRHSGNPHEPSGRGLLCARCRLRGALGQLLVAPAVGGFKAAAGGTGLRTLARLAGPFHR